MQMCKVKKRGVGGAGTAGVGGKVHLTELPFQTLPERKQTPRTVAKKE